MGFRLALSKCGCICTFKIIIVLNKLRHLGTSCCPAWSLTVAFACAGSSSSNHCNAHGGRQFYLDMRTRARAVGPDVTTPAPTAARPPGLWEQALQRARNIRSTSTAGPSAPTTAERRHSSGPAGAVGSSATNAHLGGSSDSLRNGFHNRPDCQEHPFQPTPSTANQQSCKMVNVSPPGSIFVCSTTSPAAHYLMAF